MITVNVKKDKSISLRGHAMYADFGKDIVCSAVSSIVITTINGILAIDPEAITYQELEDGLDIVINKKDEITDKLISNMIDLLKNLEEQYSDNIKVKGD